MKMTMHIDEALLNRVIERFGFSSKTEAVEMALREMDRKARFKEVVSKGIGLTPEEMKDAVDPDYDVLSMRAAESSVRYGSKYGGKRSR